MGLTSDIYCTFQIAFRLFFNSGAYWSNDVPGTTCPFLRRVYPFSFSITHLENLSPNLLGLMSYTLPPPTSANFQLIFDNALVAYKKRTKKDLFRSHAPTRWPARTLRFG